MINRDLWSDECTLLRVATTRSPSTMRRSKVYDPILVNEPCNVASKVVRLMTPDGSLVYQTEFRVTVAPVEVNNFPLVTDLFEIEEKQYSVVTLFQHKDLDGTLLGATCVLSPLVEAGLT